MPDRARAKQVLLQIVRQANGKLTRRSDLDAAFYLAHLLYAQRNPGYLTDWPIVRLSQGPGIGQAKDLLAELVTEGRLEARRVRFGPWATLAYRPAGPASPGQGLDDESIDAIRDAVDQVQALGQEELRQLTREFSRSWNLAADGEELNIYIDLLAEDEYLDSARRIDELAASLKDA